MSEATTQPDPSTSYFWRIRVRVGLLASGDQAQDITAGLKTKRGTTFLLALLVLGLLLLAPALILAVGIGGPTVILYQLLDGLAGLVGRPVVFGLALAVVLGVCVLALAAFIRTVWRSVSASWKDGLARTFGNVLANVKVFRFYAVLVSFLALGPLSYVLVSMAALWPGSFSGDVSSTTQWERYFGDLLLNGLFVGLPQKLGRLSSIQPVAWYARVAVTVHNAIILYGVIWMIHFVVLKYHAWTSPEVIEATLPDLARHLHDNHYIPLVTSIMPGLKEPDPLDPVLPAAPEPSDGALWVIGVECLGKSGGARPDGAFHREVKRYLTDTLGQSWADQLRAKAQAGDKSASSQTVVLPATAAASSGELTLTFIQHAPLFLWWPIWFVCFVFAAMSYFDGARLAVVPAGTQIQAVGEGGRYELVAAGPVTPSLAHALEAEPGQEAFPIRVARQGRVGVIFLTVLTMIILLSSMNLDGMLGDALIVLVILVNVGLAVTGLWDPILAYLGLFQVYLNAGAYLVLGGVLFLAWMVSTTILDRAKAIHFTPSHIIVEDLGTPKKYPYHQVRVTQKANLFRDQILGFGSGNLILTLSDGPNVEVIDLPNVLFVRRKLLVLRAIIERATSAEQAGG